MAGPGLALQITSLTPQGEVARVRQVVAKFDQAAVNFGDPQGARPAHGELHRRAGRQGHRPLDRRQGLGLRLRERPAARRALHGHPHRRLQVAASGELTGPERYQFNTGGPFVRNSMPGSYSRIDEQQMFVLELNGAATLDERAPQHLVRRRRRGRAHPGQAARRRAARRPAQGLRPRQGRRERPAALRHHAVQPHADARQPRCRSSTARAWPRLRACPTTWNAASTSRCASPSPSRSPASARTRRPPACRCAPMQLHVQCTGHAQAGRADPAQGRRQDHQGQARERGRHAERR